MFSSADSQRGSDFDSDDVPLKDPLQSISSGCFSNMQFNTTPTGIYRRSVINLNSQQPRNNSPHTYVEKSTSTSRSDRNYSAEDAVGEDACNSTKPLMPAADTHGVKPNSKLGTNDTQAHLLQPKASSRSFTRKKYAFFFLISLFMALFLYGSVFDESMRNVSSVLKSKVDKISNVITHQKHDLMAGGMSSEALENELDDIGRKLQASHQECQSNLEKVPMITRKKGNRRCCPIKKTSNNCSNVTEKKYTRVSKASEETGEQKPLTVPVSKYYARYDDHTFISSEHDVPCETQLLAAMKKPGMQPGQCWAFKGSQGILVVQLAYEIYPTGFAIDHIPTSMSPSDSIDSAPKDFSVWGVMSKNDVEAKPLGLYSYDLKGYSLQYFPVQNAFNYSFRFVELRIHSNHGNSKYTCLCRFKVYGRIDKETFDKTAIF